MTTRLRTAEAKDIRPITTLIRAAFAEYTGVLDPPSSAQHKTEAQVRAELTGGSALVYDHDGILAGCVFIHPHDDHVYLDRLSVHPAFRRQGIARALIATAEYQARERGFKRVRLSVRLALQANRAWYERIGYRFFSYGTHTGYTTPTYVTLEKTLDEPERS